MSALEELLQTHVTNEASHDEAGTVITKSTRNSAGIGTKELQNQQYRAFIAGSNKGAKFRNQKHEQALIESEVVEDGTTARLQASRHVR